MCLDEAQVASCKLRADGVALAGRGGIAAAPGQRDPVLLEGARNRVGVEHDAVTDGGGADAELAGELGDELRATRALGDGDDIGGRFGPLRARTRTAFERGADVGDDFVEGAHGFASGSYLAGPGDSPAPRARHRRARGAGKSRVRVQLRNAPGIRRR